MTQIATSPRLGIVISMFPELHETFILRELVALDKAGVSFDIYSLQFPRDPITLEDAQRLSSQRTTYSGLITRNTMAAMLRAVRRQPLAVVRACWQVVWQGRDRPRQIIRNLAILPVTLHFGEVGVSRGTTHWHGHWANIPTTSCWFLQQIHGVTWSAAIHGEDIFTRNRFLARKLDAASFAVVCSDYFCQHLKGQLGLRYPERVHLNYHGLDPAVIDRVAQRPGGIARQDGTRWRLISIGRLVATKGHDVVLKAVARLCSAGIADIQLEIVGTGPLHDPLCDLAIQLGIEDHVQFVGALSFSEVLDRLCMADVFCLAPRLIAGKPPDGIPNVIAEAMALRVPVVTTRVSAIPELVEAGVSGCLVEVDDHVAMGKAIQQVMENTEFTERMIDEAAGKVARLFDQSANIDELLAYFAQYVPGRVVDE